MRLDLIANEEMKDPTAWKEVARLNKIKDGLVFPAKAELGKQLLVPDVEHTDG
jgi:hypothetical protein